MPAPSFLKGLPKPILFGLYGAIGGLIGALIFAEPLYRALEPDKAPPPPPPEPQLAVSASPDVQVYAGSRNTFTVQIARAEFDEPVTVHFEGLPAGISIEKLVIPKGATDGTATIVATDAARSSTGTIRVIADADAGKKLLTATTVVSSVVAEPGRALADIVFVMDVTASMDWAIDGVSRGIGEFATYMRDNKIDFRVGVVAFRDLWIDQNSEVLMFPAPKGGNEPFTTDDRDFSRKVGQLRATGGGDAPESTLDAIIEASKMPFRKGATKVLLVITDNPPKNLHTQGGSTRDNQTASPANYDETAKAVTNADIDIVHLVLPNGLRVYNSIQEAGKLKGKGRTFDLDKVSRNPDSFQKLVADFGEAVKEAAKAKNPEGKPQISQAAAKPEIGVKAVQSDASYAKGTEGKLTLAVGVWTGAISALVCLTLLAGQTHYLRGAFPDASNTIAGLLGGLVVGIVGGASGQGLFFLAPDSAVLAAVFRVLGWALLGGLAGAGLSLFIPNLKWVHGLAGGAIGGAAGALGFIAVSSVTGDLVGRLVGGLILGFAIGLMVALVEAAFRRAWLEVRYGTRETITVNLGPEPVKIGGDARACTVWARGAADVALRYFIRNGQVICEDAPTRTQEVAANGDVREVGNVMVTVRTGTSAVPAKPEAASRPARPPVPPKLPTPPKPLDMEPSLLDEDPLPLPVPAKPQAAPAPPVPPKPQAASSPPAPKHADACPNPKCGRVNPGRAGSRYCMICDLTY